MTAQEDKEDKEAILKAIYDGSSTEVVFRHFATNTTHRVLSNARAIGITFCGIRILRRDSPGWAGANFEPVTCMVCLGAL